MWKLRLASKVVGKSSSLGLIKLDPLSSKARYCGLSSAAVMLVFGLVAIILQKSAWFIGVYCVALSSPLCALEFPFAPFGVFVRLVNFFTDYKRRIALWAVVGVPPLFNLVTVIAGIACFATAIFYGVCLFRGEHGELLKIQQSPDESNSSKKVSLASQDQTPA